MSKGRSKGRQHKEQHAGPAVHVLGDLPEPVRRGIGPDGRPTLPQKVEPASWPDPTDTSSMARGEDGRRRQKAVAGWRAVNPLLRLHATNPKDFTAHHVRAAARLQDDYEIAEGAVGIGNGLGSGGGDPVSARLDAVRRFRLARDAVGRAGCEVLLPVVLNNLTLADLAKRRNENPHRVAGRLSSALDRLAEHYWPPAEAPGRKPAALVDPAVTDIGQDRLGRVGRDR